MGVGLIGLSCWVMLISESLLLSKVHSQMQTALEDMNTKREAEVEELLTFLKHSYLASNPFDSWDGAKRFVDRAGYPAFLMGPTFDVVKANVHMTDLLGWGANSLNGIAGHIINDNTIMSKVGEICTKPPHDTKSEMSLRYIYLHKNGSKVFGLLSLVKIHDGGFLMSFFPDSKNILGDGDLMTMLG